MKKLISTIIMLVIFGCGPPPRPLPPPDGPGTCETAAANLRELGGCGHDPAKIEQLCSDTEETEAEIGVRLPVGCLTAAKSCEEALRCE